MLSFDFVKVEQETRVRAGLNGSDMPFDFFALIDHEAAVGGKKRLREPGVETVSGLDCFGVEGDR